MRSIKLMKPLIIQSLKLNFWRKVPVYTGLPVAKNAVMHDWWIGLVASYFGKIEYLKDGFCAAEELNALNGVVLE